MQRTFAIRFEGVSPVATYEYPIEWGRSLVTAMRKAIPEARASDMAIHVTFPQPGASELTFAFSPEVAEEYANEIERSITRTELLLQRGAVHPIGKVELIKRDSHGEMAVVETSYKF